MIPRSMELYLRAHTHVEGEEPSSASSDFPDGWAPIAVIFDCETTIDARQTFNFAFYRKCELRGNLYVCIEEGIVYADNLEKRLGKHAVELLTKFAAAERTDTVRGRRARMRLYSQTDFVKKVLLPMYLKGAVIVGANLCFDLSRLAVDYKDPDDPNDVWSLVFKKHKGLPDKIQPRLIMTPRNSRSAFLKFTFGHKDYGYGNVSGGRFLDVLTLAFGLRNTHYSLDGACSEWNVPGKLKHDPTGRVTSREIKYCRQDVKCTLDLLNVLKREFDARPVGIPPESVWSPASLSKAFLDSMGLQHPPKKFSLSDTVHGIAMQSYYGGRAECRIRKTKLPTMFVDFTSQYPTCNSLLGIWDFMIAEDVSVQEATKEVREFLHSVTLERMFNRNRWRQLNFIALVEPQGDMLPVRAVYNDVEGESTNIGINPLTSKVPIWYSGPDLAASKILTGRSLKILKAIRITPEDVQKGLRPTTLGGRKIIPSAIISTTSWSKGRNNLPDRSESSTSAWRMQAATLDLLVESQENFPKGTTIEQYARNVRHRVEDDNVKLYREEFPLTVQGASFVGTVFRFFERPDFGYYRALYSTVLNGYFVTIEVQCGGEERLQKLLSSALKITPKSKQ